MVGVRRTNRSGQELENMRPRRAARGRLFLKESDKTMWVSAMEFAALGKFAWSAQGGGLFVAI